MKKLKLKWNALGLIATIGGAVFTVLGYMADEKSQEKLIEEKVEECLAKRSKN